MQIKKTPKKTKVGKNALLATGPRQFKFPLVRGICQDWDFLCEVFKYIYTNELQIEFGDYPVVLTEAPLTPKSARAKMAEMLFGENMGVSGLFFFENSLVLYF